MDPQQQLAASGLLGMALAGLFAGWQATINYLERRDERHHNLKQEQKRTKRLRRRLREAKDRIAELEGRKPDGGKPRLAGGGSP